MAPNTKKLRIRRAAWIESEMLYSEAFRTLPRTAMWMIMRFHQKVTWTYTKVGGRKIRVRNLDGLTYPASESEAFGIPRASHYRNMDILYRRGFIDYNHRGGEHRRDFSRYKLIEDWKEWPKNEKTLNDKPPMQGLQL